MWMSCYHRALYKLHLKAHHGILFTYRRVHMLQYICFHLNTSENVLTTLGVYNAGYWINCYADIQIDPWSWKYSALSWKGRTFRWLNATQSSYVCLTVVLFRRPLWNTSVCDYGSGLTCACAIAVFANNHWCRITSTSTTHVLSPQQPRPKCIALPLASPSETLFPISPSMQPSWC